MNSQVVGRRAAFVRRCALVLCLAALPVLSGCVVAAVVGIGVVVAAGAGVVVYIKGNLTQTVNAPQMKVHDAAVKALKDLRLPLLSDQTDQMTTKMTSQFPDGTEVWLTFEAVSYQSTKITVRVGIMGEEQRAREILQKIQKHLGL